MMDSEIWNFIGKLVTYGGGGVAISYAVFVFFGKKIIDQKFAEKSLDFKHQKNKDLAEFKSKIDSLLNRVTKIHEKEFEVLPKAWEKIQDSFSQLSYFTRVFREYPDFSAMNDAQIDTFLENSVLHDFEKEKLKTEIDKLSYYQSVIFWHEYNDVRKEFSEFVQYIRKNKIFLSEDLQEQFKILETIIWGAIVDQEVGHTSDDRKMKRDAYKTVNEQIQPIVDKIEIIVQKRLKFSIAE